MNFKLTVFWRQIGCFALISMQMAVGAATLAAEPNPRDWPNWRGPQKNSTSTEKGLVDHWDPSGGAGSNLIWKNTELAGRSSPIVLRGKLYTICRDQADTKNDGEKVVCADAETGEILWEHRFNVYISEVPDTRVGWSSCVADPATGRIYAQGVCGYFCCLDGETGKLIWDHSLHEEYGLISTFGGRTNVPVVFDDLVLTSAVVVGWGDAPKWDNLAIPAHRFFAFDKATGELRWLAGTNLAPFDTTYSTPFVGVVGGQAELIFGSGDGGVWALQPRTGKRIWWYPFSRRGINVSPLVTSDGHVYMGHSEENVEGSTMGSLVSLDGTMSGDLLGKELWHDFGVMIGKSSPLEIDGRIYAVDDGAKLYVFDAETGEQIARKALGASMRSTPVYADGKIYLCTNGGRWYVLKPTDDGVEIVDKMRLDPDQCNGSPAISNGRIYLPTSEAIYCIGDLDRQPAADPLPAELSEEPIASDTKPAQLQLIPYDVALEPGDEQTYHVRLFNSRGQLLRTVPADECTFSVDGPGSVSSDATYVAPSSAGHECALVTCQFGDLTDSARVRIVPPLPWEFDFNDAELAPLTWIGGRVRWVVKQENGEQFLAKRTILPTPRNPNNKLGTHSYLWMGSPKLSNYTIQADVLLTEEEGHMPDIGLINSGYEFTIRAQNGMLRLSTWTTSDHRVSAVSQFTPDPGVWYTMKFSVTPSGDRATAQGKIWPRGTEEPDDWTVEIVDQSPNLHGTPGIFGNSPEAEIYLDNVMVTPN